MGIAILFLAASLPRALADPIADKRAEAAAIASRLDDQARHITSLGRQYLTTQARLAQTSDALTQAEVDLRAANDRRVASEARLVARALTAYLRGGAVSSIEQLARGNGSDLIARRQYLAVAAATDRQALDQLRAARQDLAQRQAHLRALKTDFAAASRVLTTSRDALVKSADGQRALLGKVSGELAGLVAAEQARRDAETARRARELAQRGVGAHAGDLGGTWACIRMLESGNNYKAPGGGAYQFSDDTWHGLGQSGTASDAPPALQDAMAVELQRQSGWSPWTTAPMCGRA